MTTNSSNKLNKKIESFYGDLLNLRDDCKEYIISIVMKYGKLNEKEQYELTLYNEEEDKWCGGCIITINDPNGDVTSILLDSNKRDFSLIVVTPNGNYEQINNPLPMDTIEVAKQLIFMEDNWN